MNSRYAKGGPSGEEHDTHLRQQPVQRPMHYSEVSGSVDELPGPAPLQAPPRRTSELTTDVPAASLALAGQGPTLIRSQQALSQGDTHRIRAPLPLPTAPEPAPVAPAQHGAADRQDRRRARQRVRVISSLAGLAVVLVMVIVGWAILAWGYTQGTLQF